MRVKERVEHLKEIVESKFLIFGVQKLFRVSSPVFNLSPSPTFLTRIVTFPIREHGLIQ